MFTSILPLSKQVLRLNSMNLICRFRRPLKLIPDCRKGLEADLSVEAWIMEEAHGTQVVLQASGGWAMLFHSYLQTTTIQAIIAANVNHKGMLKRHSMQD